MLRRLAELARLFLKIGTISFGGPAAHLALMEDEVVKRRAWLTGEEFLDLVRRGKLNEARTRMQEELDRAAP